MPYPLLSVMGKLSGHRKGTICRGVYVCFVYCTGHCATPVVLFFLLFLWRSSYCMFPSQENIGNAAMTRGIGTRRTSCSALSLLWAQVCLMRSCRRECNVL